MFRPLPLLSVLALAAFAVLIALGVWQMQRREEKHMLLDQIATRSAAPPEQIEILLATGNYAAHRNAVATGTFDHAKKYYVWHPRTDGGPTRQGKKVVTPFVLASGGTILVDRGWVDNDWPSRDKSVAEPEGEVEIEGVLRPPSKPGPFTPEPDMVKRLFFVRDAAAIAKAAGVTLKSPLILEATKRLGNPEPLSTTLDIPDNHLGYAITWFGLAIVLVVIYLRFHIVKGRLRFSR